MSQKAIVAMSGGVDSSVAAALLSDEGLDVTGLTMHLYTCARAGDRSCCSASDRMDARSVCENLGIGLRVSDMRDRFRRMVIAPFVSEYLKGRTPSPCIRCNDLIKFPALLEESSREGAHVIATGHYARVEESEGIFRLLMARDRRKDQSYFLFGLTQEVLSRLRLPLGEMTKDEVRATARARCLPVSEKSESQEICFVPDDDYAGFLEGAAGDALAGPGDFVDTDGGKLGRHRGIHSYTVGQRRGLRIGGGPRRYVVRIERGSNAVVLGTNEDLMCSGMVVRDVSWIHPSFARRRTARVRIRSAHSGEEAALDPIEDGRVRVSFAKPVRAVAPGQAAVFYDGEEILGGGWIG